MNIMFVHNTAGALTPVADWLVDNGHKAVIFLGIDLFELSTYSPNARMKGTRALYEMVIEYIINTGPDVIHINSGHAFIPFIRLFTQRIPIVFMYHGSDARTRTKLGLAPRRVISWADKVLVSTPDLGDYGEWYDRPVPSFFRYTGGRVKGSALMIYAEFFAEYGKDKRKLAREVCSKLGLDLTIRQRRNENPIPHSEMPKLYSQYEYFLDFKGHDSDKTFALSKSALEAMSCGCIVLQDKDPYIPIIPADYLKGEELLQRYVDLYAGLRKESYAKVIPRFIKAVGQILMSPKTDSYTSTYWRPTLYGFVKLGFYTLCAFKCAIRRRKE